MELKEKIIQEINKNRVILFMKGSKEMPMCGFSATVVKILSLYNIDFKAVNVLDDPNIRIELSNHSNWPTIPQLFVKGKLIGGCDIVMELESNGKLKDILDSVDT